MKKLLFSGSLLVILTVLLFAFRSAFDGTISGKVTPADGAEKVWAISATDTLQGTVMEGAFALPAKAGTYKVVIDAKEPYKDVTMDNVQVTEGQSVDLGEIQLQQ